MTEKVHVKQWTTVVEYYDTEDGMQLTKNNATRNYIVVKTEKITTYNHLKTKGYVTIYKQCRKQPQRKLFD